MAVDLRCPDCRANLRLPSAPEPGTEVECPKCGSVFTVPDLEADDAPAGRTKRRRDDEEKPRKSRPARDDDDDSEEEGDRPQKKPAKKKPSGDKQPKKRKAKKKETNRTLLIGMIVGGVMFLVTLILLLVWFFGRKPVAYEMLSYLPEDCNAAGGLNVGHVQKYPEFFKSVETSYQGLEFKKVADAVASALGAQTNDLVDYVVQGLGGSGGAIVIRTKKEVDAAALAKLPGAREGAADGQKYYVVNPISGVGSGGARVFAPTNRLIVFCPGTVSDGTFRKMLTGNKDNSEKTLVGRLGPLGKRTVRGTYWGMLLLDDATRPAAPPKDDKGGSNEAAFQKQMAATAANAKGFGFKVSVGSRSVRFEAILWCRDADAASEQYQKFKESDLAKADDAEPPKWWKDFEQKQISNKKVGTELLANVGAKSSGELFIFYSACDTKILMEVLSSMASKLAGTQGGGNSPGGVSNPGGGPGRGGPPGPGGMVPGKP